MRFDELAKRADAILGSKQVDFEFEGKTHFKVDRAEVLTWGTSVVNLLQRVLGEDSVHFKKFHAHFENFDRWESQFSDYRAIFRAAKEDYEGGYLFKVRSLIQAEVFDDALEQAAELLRAGYKDPACVVVGVTLETTLKELCTRNGIATGKL